MLGYQFEVKYKQGCLNTIANSLSRRYEEGELQSMASFPTWLDAGKLVQEAFNDEKLQQIVADLQNNGGNHPGFTLQRFSGKRRRV